MIAEPLHASRRDPKHTEGEETEEERWGQPLPEPQHRLYDMKAPRKNKLVTFADAAALLLRRERTTPLHTAPQLRSKLRCHTGLAAALLAAGRGSFFFFFPRENETGLNV